MATSQINELSVKNNTKTIFHSAIFIFTGLIITVLFSFFIIGAFWEPEHPPLPKVTPPPVFPVEKSVHLRSIIEAELSGPGILEATSRKKPIQQDKLKWIEYEYVVHLEKPAVFSDIVSALSESIYTNGGKIFQTYFRSGERKASIVIGVDSFITHTIALTWDAPLRMAIVIDDLGGSEEVVQRLLDLKEDFTFSILPHLEKSAKIATLLHDRQKEVLLHLPMEPQGNEYPGKGAITMNMTPDRIQRTIEQDLQTVPHAVGVNNHMGSRLTANPEKMQTVLHTLRRHNLFFLDSRTTSRTVAYKTAQQLGLKSAERKVFLDVVPQYDFVQNQLRELASLAEQGEPAIAIGHPKEVTLRALKAMLPEFRDRDIQIVRLSRFLQ
jgi:polysaccharide deacetylase 2 family uncharacterized protein YibQ